MTPNDVQTSVSRCLSSAVNVTQRCGAPVRKRSMSMAPVTAVATVEVAGPSPAPSSAAGCRKRCTAVTR